MDEMRYDIWYQVGSTYKCGCCGRIPTYLDIKYMRECPKCHHYMTGYETENSIEPIVGDAPKEEHRDWHHIPY